MKIIVGSMNPSKLQAVRTTLVAYPSFSTRVPFLGGFADALDVEGITAMSGVPEQPIGLDQIVDGATNRARYVLERHPDALAIGIESGVYLLPQITGRSRGLFDVCACVIAGAGREGALGFSSAWPVPHDVAVILLSGGDDLAKVGKVTMDDAFVQTGRTHNPRIGYSEGAVGLLTGNRLTRTAYTAQAVTAALVGWEDDT